MPSPRRRPNTAPVMGRHRFVEVFDDCVAQIETRLRGKTDVVRLVLSAGLAGGHVLLEDLPGTGKTVLARATAATLGGSAGRVSCTPDLLPSDITGSPIFDRNTGAFTFREGPVFTNVLLVDEINRATPKTQSALLEAMQERAVTVDGRTYPLPDPFLLIATQNPVDLSGTFPLPEAQLDRFLVRLSLGAADRDVEVGIVADDLGQTTAGEPDPATDVQTVQAMSSYARSIAISEPLRFYLVDLCRATRTDPAVRIGASTRASLALARGARVLAAAQGREDVLPDDIRRLAEPVLLHRLVLEPDATLRGDTPEAVVERALAAVRIPAGV